VVAGALEGRLEALLDELAARKEVFAASMGVATGEGSFRWLGARGEVGPEQGPVRPDTPWFVASVTKLHIAASVMRLVEEGDLRLEDRVLDHLPATRGLHVLGGVDRTGEITVEHLLAHASGLPDFIEDHPGRRGRGAGGGGGGATGAAGGAEGATAGTGAHTPPFDPSDRRSLVEILVEEGDRDWTLEDTLTRVRERLRPLFPPQRLDGERVRIRYSDTNFQLLMALVETRSGLPFHQALQGLVLDPLGLRRTWVPGHPPGGGDEPPVVALRNGAEILDFPRFFRSIGDLNATSHDLLDFLMGLEQGRLFRDAGTWPRMQARWNRFSQPTDRAALRQPGWPIQYGLGVMRFQLPRFFTPFRPIPAVVGHTGSTGTWLFHVPELDLYLVGAVNQITAGPLPYRFVPKVIRGAMESGVG